MQMVLCYCNPHPPGHAWAAGLCSSQWKVDIDGETALAMLFLEVPRRPTSTRVSSRCLGEEQQHEVTGEVVNTRPELKEMVVVDVLDTERCYNYAFAAFLADINELPVHICFAIRRRITS